MKPGSWRGVVLAFGDFSYVLMLENQLSKLPGSTAGGDRWRLMDRFREQARSHRGIGVVLGEEVGFQYSIGWKSAIASRLAPTGECISG
jgi:hypothetical protein